MQLKDNIEEDIPITNLDYLLTLGIFKGIIDKNITEINIKEFTEKFNQFFFKSGEYGYEDAYEINIDTSKSYTEEQVEKYILAVQDTLDISDSNIEIKELKEVPYILSLELYKKVGTNSADLKKGDISFGIYRGNEVVGYVNGSFWDLGLSIGGLYIKEKYQKRGFSIQLLEKMMEKSIEKGFNRLELSNASWQGQGALCGLAKKYNKEGKNVQFEMGDEDLKNYAILEVDNKGNENSYFKNRENVDENFIDIF